MPHYTDGTEAKRGDIVRGKGYNHPYPVQGVVLNVAPGSASCNITIAIPKLGYPLSADPKVSAYGDLARASAYTRLEDERIAPVELVNEYGTCADFELIHRPEAQANGALS